MKRADLNRPESRNSPRAFMRKVLKPSKKLTKGIPL